MDEVAAIKSLLRSYSHMLHVDTEKKSDSDTQSWKWTNLHPLTGFVILSYVPCRDTHSWP